MQNQQIRDLVTIVTPVYDGEAFLPAYLDSVLSSEYENWELLMVDDGSRDASADIIREYAQRDEKIHYIESEHHNAGYSRNVGIDLARGEYICFFDCDDLVKPAFLKEMVNALKENNADLAFCKSEAYLQDSGEIKSLDWSFRKRFFPEEKVFSRRQCPDNLFQTNLIAAWNKMARTDLLRNNGIHAQSIPSANDVVLSCLMLACAERIVPVDQVLYTQRRNNRSSITANLGSANYLCGYLSAEMLHDELEKRGLLEEVLSSYQKLAVHNSVWYLEKIENDPQLLRQQFEFLKNEGFRRLEAETISEKAERTFLDKRELQKYHDIIKCDFNEYCARHGIETGE